jgi:hypothetical protein
LCKKMRGEKEKSKMRKSTKAPGILIGSVAIMVFVCLPAFALSTLSPAADAPSRSAFTVQAKILAIISGVYALLQGIKKALPVSGWGSIIGNIVLAVGGVLGFVRPEKLFSVGTAILVINAVAGAAGFHSLITWFQNRNSPPVPSPAPAPPHRHRKNDLKNGGR